MKKILYATDFSWNAERAFHFALRIAEKHNAELIMLHVFGIPPVWSNTSVKDPSQMISQASINWESKLRELFEKFESDLEPTFIAIEHNSVNKAILTVIEKYKPYLVVTGVKGKSVVKEIFVGSTTKALLKQSPVPLLAVPENADYRDFNKVIYASDLQHFDLNSIERLIEFVRPYKSEIKVIHICTENKYKNHEKMDWFRDLIKENISYKNISFELLISDNLFAKLNTISKQDEFDLMVMLEKEHSRIVDKLFHEDLVWKMEFNTSIPLLSYNEHFLRETDDQVIKSGDAIEH